MEVQAATSRTALIKAIASVKLNQGELFHVAHIGRPSVKQTLPEDDSLMDRVLADGMDFMDRHDAAFRELADRCKRR